MMSGIASLRSVNYAERRRGRRAWQGKGGLSPSRKSPAARVAAGLDLQPVGTGLVIVVPVVMTIPVPLVLVGVPIPTAVGGPASGMPLRAPVFPALALPGTLVQADVGRPLHITPAVHENLILRVPPGRAPGARGIPPASNPRDFHPP